MMAKDRTDRCPTASRWLICGLCIAFAAPGVLGIANGAKAQSERLAPAVRYDVLKFKLDQAIGAKDHRQTIAIITRLRATRLGVGGEIPFYEGRAYIALKNWTGAYRSLVSYLNSVGRKGKNYRRAIGLFVTAERAVKKERLKSVEFQRTDRAWQIASAAYEAATRKRNAWKSKIATFGGSGNDMAWAIARRSKGGFMVGGTLRKKIGKGKEKKPNLVMGLVAFNRKGVILWNRGLGSATTDASVRSLSPLADGGFLVGGIHGGFQIAARIDHNAILTKDRKDDPWIAGFAKSDGGASGVVVKAGDGNFIAIGAETITRKGKSPLLPFAVRLSRKGETLGKTVYSGDAALFRHDITDATVLTGGDVVAVGEAKPQAAWDTRAAMGYLLRISPKGKMAWARRIPSQGKGDVRFTAVAGAHDGGVIAAGHEGRRLLIIKTGPDGVTRWRKTISVAAFVPKRGQELCAMPDLVTRVQSAQKRRKLKVSDDKHIAVVRAFTCPEGSPFLSAAAVEPRDGGYLILGFQGWGNREKTDLRLIAIDENGNVRWDKVYGHEGFDIATGALVTEDGGFIVVGATDSAGAGGRDFLLFKIDRFGEFAPWEKLGPPQKVKPAPKKPPKAKIKPKAKAKAAPAPAAKAKTEPVPADKPEAQPKAPAKEPKEAEQPDQPGTSANEGDSAASEPPGSDENPPDTSFGSIFGSVFGSDNSDDSDTPESEEKQNKSEKQP